MDSLQELCHSPRRGLKEVLPRRKSFWLVPTLIIGLLLCSVTLLYPLLYARYLLHELNDLQLNRSTFEDAQKFAKKMGAPEADWAKCTPAECRWYKSTDNALLPKWYRGKGVTFAITFMAKGSLVTDKGVEYSIGVSPFTPEEAFIGRPRVYVYQTGNWSEWQKEHLRRHQEGFLERPTDYVEPPVDKGWQKIWYDQNGKITVDYFTVAISPRSKSIPGDWQKYTAFNYSCFWMYKGCTYGKDLLPIAGPYPSNDPLLKALQP